jgi:hypothetical protein
MTNFKSSSEFNKAKLKYKCEVLTIENGMVKTVAR